MSARRERRARRRVAPLVVALSLAWLPSLAGPGRAGAEPPERPAAPPAESPPAPAPATLGTPAAFGTIDSSESRVTLAEGTAVHEIPDRRAAVLAVIDAPSELSVLERKGPWGLVRYGAFKGWVLLPGEEGRPGSGGALPPRPADPEIVARALAALPGDDEPGRLGPYVFYTDLDSPKLLHRLNRVAADLDGRYRRRYGLDPGSPAGEAVVLFSREADYRSFASGDLAFAGLGEEGHAGFGVAALFTEGLEDSEVAALLVHELTHLINARALGPDTPPWLEEGLANDLGYSRIDAVGRLFLGSFGGNASVIRQRLFDPSGGSRVQLTVTRTGGYVALARLVHLLDREQLPPLAVVMHLAWRQLVDPAGRAVAYAESALFIRYLLDGGDDQLAAAFRRYLVGITEGGPDDAETLREALGRRWEDLDKGFGRWLRTVDLSSG